MTTPPTPNRYRVMIVDDQLEVRRGLALILQSDPRLLVTDEAENGQRALEKLEVHAHMGNLLPEVVLMDVCMPIMDGITATRQMVQTYPAVKVLVLTTYDEDNYAFGALQAGAAGFLLKDARSKELCDAICAVAEGDAVLTPRITRELLSRSPLMQRQCAPIEQNPLLSSGLTDHEKRICELIAQGLSNAEIAEILVVQPTSMRL